MKTVTMDARLTLKLLEKLENLIKEKRHVDHSEPITRKFMETKTWDDCIVADPAICHGEPTVCARSILVADVLEQVESGMAWEAIIEEWRYAVTSDAIAEAVRNRT